MTPARTLSVLLLLATSLPFTGGDRSRSPRGSALQRQSPDIEYNGRFTFTRVRYGADSELGQYGRRRRGWGASWNHDYPDGDLNMQLILNEVTSMAVNVGRSNVVDLNDPAIFNYPVLYISEPGYWSVNDAGAANLRDFLHKGGFLILDDFEDTGGQWPNVQEQLTRVLPEARILEVPATHPVFDSFFRLEEVDVPHPLVRVEPVYLGIFEDNDSTERLMVMLNLNSDLAEYWEYAGTDYFPMDLTNDAWRLGVNYIVYGLTH